MVHKKSVLYAASALLAVAVACSKSASTPVAPAATVDPSTGSAADGSTLKSGVPNTVSPTGGTQVTDPIVLTASAVTAKYASVPMSYQFQVRSGSTVVYDSGATGSVTHTPVSSAIAPDTNYTWRVRTVYQGAAGSWSSDASFKSPVGAYLRNGELRDPLTIGRTIGTTLGSVTFTSEGASIDSLDSSIRYTMDQTVTAGEFSFMAKNIKSAAPGGKTKMMSIQQGTDGITDNPYRFTVEKRGSAYVAPGQTRFRIITGHATNNVYDSNSVVPNYDTSRWYFWKATWATGFARVVVRLDNETGPIVADVSTPTSSTKPYAPNPMVAYVGSPIGRAGPEDASVPRIIVKNVWLSAAPRPAFPN